MRVSIEEYGDSPMAERFGVRRYPVVFVDDVLVARPKDFGFGGKEDISGGLYVPWLDPANQRRFKEDLTRAVSRRLAGETVKGLDVSDVTTDADASDAPATLPSIELKDINGQVIPAAQLAGRPVVIEMWATWCPPCKSTMNWLKSLQSKYGTRASVIAIAVDSTPEDVKGIANRLKPNYRIVMGSAEVIKAYGAVAAVPKVLVYDSRGQRARVIYGAPPDLHDQIDAAVRAAIRSAAPR